MGNKTRRRKMRHGYEWWETFWKWLLNESKDPPYIPDDIDLDEWLRDKKKLFTDMWREGLILPPKGRET